MKIANEFIQLPFEFDIKRLKDEIDQLDTSYWQPHHENFKGNYAVPLISVNGQANNDFKGPMQATDALKKMPYIQQVISSFGEVFGRSRLMSLDPGSEVPLHNDINYYWYNRVRIHVPIVTDERVLFYCGDKKVHMGAGESWIFDSWKNHRVVNGADFTRVHLVIDTAGSSKFWQMVNDSAAMANQGQALKKTKIEFDANRRRPIMMEKHNAPLVMSPGEVDGLVADLKYEINCISHNDKDKVLKFERLVDGFCQDWRQLWSVYGQAQAGWEIYHKCRDNSLRQCQTLGQQLNLTNGGTAFAMLLHCIIDPALSIELANIN